MQTSVTQKMVVLIMIIVIVSVSLVDLWDPETHVIRQRVREQPTHAGYSIK